MEADLMNYAPHTNLRKHRRYPVSGEVFIGTSPFYRTVGSLKDLSQGGAAFEYVSSTNHVQSRDVEVDILCGKHLRFSRLLCKVTYDIRVDKPSSGSAKTRRCGLEFGSLSRQQADLLSLILSSCASTVTLQS
jgi:hypothetical protein